jgi:hypothetical protein
MDPEPGSNFGVIRHDTRRSIAYGFQHVNEKADFYLKSFQP